MEGWTLLKRKCTSCNTMTLLQANDMISSNINNNSSSASEECLTVSTPKKHKDDDHVSNASHYMWCKAHAVTDKTKIDSARVPSAMNDCCNHCNHDNVEKGKTLVTLSTLDDNSDGSSANNDDPDDGVLFDNSTINNAAW